MWFNMKLGWGNRKETPKHPHGSELPKHIPSSVAWAFMTAAELSFKLSLPLVPFSLQWHFGSFSSLSRGKTCPLPFSQTFVIPLYCFIFKLLFHCFISPECLSVPILLLDSHREIPLKVKNSKTLGRSEVRPWSSLSSDESSQRWNAGWHHALCNDEHLSLGLSSSEEIFIYTHQSFCSQWRETGLPMPRFPSSLHLNFGRRTVLGEMKIQPGRGPATASTDTGVS